MIALELDDLRGSFGFGVAGNFAGHLEQAGEAGDFVAVEAAAQAPKGIFPFYAPGSGTFLETFPVASGRLEKPESDGPVNLQIEPEVALLCRVEYDTAGTVSALLPRAVAAFNDCSIRREGAAKISHKKNWGAASKGLATRAFPVEELAADTATLRLACFLRRDGETHAYGIDSAVLGYSYYGEQLLDWMVDRLREQRSADGTPLEDVGALLLGAGCPAEVVVGIGATRYTELGAFTYLDVGDTSVVVLYDAAAADPEHVAATVADGREDELAAASVLRQVVVAGAPAPRL
ncbi:MAG: hypothetical protein H0V81_04230 [Solirubrobacterales bacterium]|nr:hypothetical protein [Solirubrobacterales bacterium]